MTEMNKELKTYMLMLTTEKTIIISNMNLIGYLSRKKSEITYIVETYIRLISITKLASGSINHKMKCDSHKILPKL